MVGAIAALAIGMSSLAQADRVDLIWSHADNRVSRQIDRWFKDGDYLRCIQGLRIRAEAAPSDYQTWTDLGWMLENVQAYGEALSVYVRFRLGNPQDPDAPFPEASFYAQRRLWARVPPLLEPTLAAKPHPNTYRTLARAYEQQGMLTDSQRVWKALLARTPNDGAAKMNLDRVERKLKGGS